MALPESGFWKILPAIARAVHPGFPVIEDRLRQGLKAAESRQVRTAFQESLEILKTIDDPTVTGEQVGEIFETFDRRLVALGAIAQQTVHRAVRDTYFLATERVGRQVVRVVPDLTFRDTRWQRLYESQALHWIREHHREDTSRQIQAIVEEIILELGPAFDYRRDIAVVGKRLKSELQDEFKKSDPYWNLLAANVVERTRNMASIAVMANAGVQFYRIRIVDDDRTSRICRDMAGRIFSVGDAVGRIEQGLESQNPEDWKATFPWFTGQSDSIAQNANTATLAGGLFPPFHGHCRSRAVPFRPGQMNFRPGNVAGRIERGDLPAPTALSPKDTEESRLAFADWEKRTDNERLGMLESVTTGRRRGASAGLTAALADPDEILMGFTPALNRRGEPTGKMDRVWRFRKGGETYSVPEQVPGNRFVSVFRK